MYDSPKDPFYDHPNGQPDEVFYENSAMRMGIDTWPTKQMLASARTALTALTDVKTSEHQNSKKYLGSLRASMSSLRVELLFTDQ